MAVGEATLCSDRHFQVWRTVERCAVAEIVQIARRSRHWATHERRRRKFVGWTTWRQARAFFGHVTLASTITTRYTDVGVKVESAVDVDTVAQLWQIAFATLLATNEIDRAQLVDRTVER